MILSINISILRTLAWGTVRQRADKSVTRRSPLFLSSLFSSLAAATLSGSSPNRLWKCVFRSATWPSMATSQDSGQYGGKPYLLDSAKSLFSTLIQESASGLCSLSKSTFLKSNFLSIVLWSTVKNSQPFEKKNLCIGGMEYWGPRLDFFWQNWFSTAKALSAISISTTSHCVDQVRPCDLPVPLAPRHQLLLKYCHLLLEGW